MQVECVIYKSKKQEELYLYIDASKQLNEFPAELLGKINTEKPIMNITLSPERKLARADVVKVMQEIQQKGFYLQLPPNDLRREMLGERP